MMFHSRNQLVAAMSSLFKKRAAKTWTGRGLTTPSEASRIVENRGHDFVATGQFTDREREGINRHSSCPSVLGSVMVSTDSLLHAIFMHASLYVEMHLLHIKMP